MPRVSCNALHGKHGNMKRYRENVQKNVILFCGSAPSFQSRYHCSLEIQKHSKNKDMYTVFKYSI
jgi:hypothetical protein